LLSGTGSFRNLGRVLEAGRSAAPVLGWSVLVGTLAGFVGGAFRWGIAHFEDGMSALRALGGDGTDLSLAISIVSAAVLVSTSLLLVRRFAPEAGGSGIQYIEGALDGVLPLRWARVLCVKFGAGLLSLGAGMVMGREGPTVQMGGALGEMLRERFRLTADTGRILVAAGAGAGLTAAFNAPLAGMLFVIEEMRPHFKYSVVSVQCVLIACAVADVVVRGLLGAAPAFALGSFPMPPLPGLLVLAGFGVVVGILGWAFNSSIFWTQDLLTPLSRGTRLALAAAVGALIGAFLQLAPELAGGGYGAIRDAMSGHVPEMALAWLLVARFALTVICFSTGVPGGIFAPMVALGTIFGIWFADFVPSGLPAFDVAPGVFMVAGAGAFFAATVRAPVTGIVLAAELTGNFQLILPVAIACISATLVAHALGGKPIYTTMLERAVGAGARAPKPVEDG
jgi:CIC family chloride channel protein